MPRYARTGILASPPKDASIAVTPSSNPDAPSILASASDTPVPAASDEQRGCAESADDLDALELIVEEEPLQPDWQALPARAYKVFQHVALLSTCAPAAIVSLVILNRFGAHIATWVAIGGVFAAAIAIGLWLAYRRYRYTFWKLDRDGFAVKRGHIWQWETRVPTTRVQHMDLKRGPLERAHGLASVILHTAGTRLSAVSVSGMDHQDAERLRDYLTRQIDRQDGDDSEHA
jgi:uncharacterized protein